MLGLNQLSWAWIYIRLDHLSWTRIYPEYIRLDHLSWAKIYPEYINQPGPSQLDQDISRIYQPGPSQLDQDISQPDSATPMSVGRSHFQGSQVSWEYLTECPDIVIEKGLASFG